MFNEKQKLKNRPEGSSYLKCKPSWRNEETQLNGELFVMKGVQSTGFRETLKLGFSGN